MSANPTQDKFWIKATRDIKAAKRTIPQGVHLLISPDLEPTEGALVLVDDNLEIWAGQPKVSGVATLFGVEI